ncbi:uncharacterized protein P884DRAFT_263814 [Thermothelomyces heterothallicus CBS 202.75]|uniref:uncharacterized protein n=1 Tax=Thermothelomyces heterothallicus CBS 202.75 TaxID=1149848 RepID=UPI003742AB83
MTYDYIGPSSPPASKFLVPCLIRFSLTPRDEARQFGWCSYRLSTGEVAAATLEAVCCQMRRKTAT